MILNYRSETVVETFATDLAQIAEDARAGKLSATGKNLSYGG